MSTADGSTVAVRFPALHLTPDQRITVRPSTSGPWSLEDDHGAVVASATPRTTPPTTSLKPQRGARIRIIRARRTTRRILASVYYAGPIRVRYRLRITEPRRKVRRVAANVVRRSGGRLTLAARIKSRRGTSVRVEVLTERGRKILATTRSVRSR